MNKMLKKILCVLVPIVLISICTISVFAHPTPFDSSSDFEIYASNIKYALVYDLLGQEAEKHNQKYNPWVIIYASHNADNKLTYRFDENDPFLTDYYKDIVNDAAKKWLPYGIITYSASSPNIIKTYYDENTDNVAGVSPVDPSPNTTNRHTIRYTLSINRASINENRMYNHPDLSPARYYEHARAVIAHEFGHAFGLWHVFGDVNNYAIMNVKGVEKRAKEDTGEITVGVQDILGLAVITGQHSTHIAGTYFPRPVDDLDGDSPYDSIYKHYGRCFECGGHVLSECYPRIAGRNCLYCGRYLDEIVERVLGDVNEDGVIDSFDLHAVLVYLAGVKVSPFRELNADVNSDGAITLYDFDRILQHYIICIGSTEWCYCGLWV